MEVAIALKAASFFCEALIWMPAQFKYTAQTPHINPLFHGWSEGANILHVSSRLVIYIA